MDEAYTVVSVKRIIDRYAEMQHGNYAGKVAHAVTSESHVRRSRGVSSSSSRVTSTHCGARPYHMQLAQTHPSANGGAAGEDGGDGNGIEGRKACSKSERLTSSCDCEAVAGTADCGGKGGSPTRRGSLPPTEKDAAVGSGAKLAND